MKQSFLKLPIVIVLVASGCQAAAAADWVVQTVDTVGDWGWWYNSLALDAAGRPHISYFVNDDYWNYRALKYAAFDGSAWQIETVESAEHVVGEHNSLAMDAAGRPHISYFDASMRDLKYAAFDGSAWQIQAVDTVGYVGNCTSLALDAAGRPHISYLDQSNDYLKYAAFDGSAWQIEAVDTAGDMGFDNSLALDAAGRPHIRYSGGFRTKYAAFDGSVWQIEDVPMGGFDASLALDAAGRPHISSGQGGHLTYAFVVPEPGTMGLLASFAAAALGLLMLRRRQRPFAPAKVGASGIGRWLALTVPWARRSERPFWPRRLHGLFPLRGRGGQTETMERDGIHHHTPCKAEERPR